MIFNIITTLGYVSSIGSFSLCFYLCTHNRPKANSYFFHSFLYVTNKDGEHDGEMLLHFSYQTSIALASILSFLQGVHSLINYVVSIV